MSVLPLGVASIPFPPQNGTGTVVGRPISPCSPSGTLNRTDEAGAVCEFVFVKNAASRVTNTSFTNVVVGSGGAGGGGFGGCGGASTSVVINAPVSAS